MQQLLLDLLPAPMPALRHFLPGDNVELLTALHGWLSAPQTELTYPNNLFVVWGMRGAGKSFLCRCLAAQGFQALPATDLVADAAYFLDDAHRLNADQQQALFRHLVQLAHCPARLFVTLDAPPNTPPDRAQTLREDVRTRLGAGHIYRLRPLDETQQRQLLAQRAEQRGWRLSNEVLDTLYRRAPRDLSSLARLIERLDQLSLEQQRRITLPLLRSALNETNDLF